MSSLKHYFDAGTLSVIIITLVLFVAALFTKGFTHDLFLEAGIFLVSVKIIILSYQNRRMNLSIEKKLDDILIMMRRIDTHQPADKASDNIFR